MTATNSADSRLNPTTLRTLIAIWAAWAVILLSFQTIADARFQPEYPDRVLNWTETETMPTSQDDQPYLIEPFMNAQVSWDSEFYLSIAIVGYDDPIVRTAPPPWRPEFDHPPVSLNYAFFPFYPFMMRIVAFPLGLLGMAPIPAATLAGTLVSLLGTLGAMLALYDLARKPLGDTAGRNAAFYLLIFPTGFFLAQIYTEGLFVGLAFGALALTQRRQWVLAALLAAFATWTRAVGVALVIPLVLAWLQDLDRTDFPRSLLNWKSLSTGLLSLSPLMAYLVWNLTLGDNFHLVEASFFSRGALLLQQSFDGWWWAFTLLSGENLQTRVYYAIEFGAIVLGLIASAVMFRRYPGLALFGLAVFTISLTSGVAQGMHRYVLGVPAIFLMLGQWGQNEPFDRAWTTGSILLMGLLAILFTFDMWVA